MATKLIRNRQWLAAGNLITWDMVHYDVNIIGGIASHEGKVAEMATGEGKKVSAPPMRLPGVVFTL